MSHFEFIVPIQRDDLLEAQQGGQYFVRSLSEACEVKSSIHELTVAFSSDRGEFVLDKFDLLFSGLKHFSALKSADREQIWELVNKGFTYLTGDITNVLEQDDIDSELRVKYLNLLKMSTYILCQMAELFENTVRPSTAFISDKGQERSKSSSATEMDWDSQRLRVLSSLYAMLQLQLRRLWDPPIPDEEFINLIGNVCYRFLENSSVSQVKSKTLRDSIFQVLGTLVRSYSHSHCCSLKMILMLQQYEHSAGVLSQGVLAMATQYGGVGLMNDMIRELAGMDAEELTREGAATRHYAEFLSLVAARAPELVLNNICLLVGHLDGESYTMRNAVLSMIGDMVSLVLTGEQLDDKQKHLRDQFLDNLEDHMHDVNAFVRTKVLQIWRKLCTDGAVPLSRQRVVLGRAVGRLHDKSSNVRKAALQLITAFLQVNPFAAKLPVAELEAQYKCERDKLSALGATVDDSDEAGDGDSDAESDEEDAEDDGGDPSLALQRAKTFLVTSLQAALGNSSFQPSLAEERLSLLKLLVEGNQETDAMEQMMAKPHLIPGYTKRQSSDTEGSKSDSPSAGTEDGLHEEAEPLTLDQLVAMLNAMDTETAAVDLAKQAEIDKQKMIVLYFRDSVEFARLMDASIPSVCGFLRSSQTTDILEAISFFVTAFEFGLLKAMVGIRSMLSLIWSREANIKDSVVTAYRRLYMPASENAKTRAAGLVDNLSTLCVDASVGELAALEELVAHLVRSGDLSDVCVQLLWQRFTRAQPGDVTPQQTRAALILIGMAAGSEPSIVSSNLDVLIQFGLQQPVAGQPLDLRVVQHACTALLKIAPKKPKPDAKHPPQRMENSHQLFSLLSDILVENIGRDDDVHYSPMALNAVGVIYLLADRPDPLMTAVVRRLSQLVADSDSSLQLARFVCVCGHAALSQMNFLDVHVFCELKRRNRVREEAKERGDGRAAQRQPARAGTGTGTPGSASETPRNRRLSQDADGDDDGLMGAVADDVEAEHINDICENHIVTGDGLLAAYLPLLVEINSNPDRYQDQRLRAAAALALSKYMTVSSVVCEQHLQLLFTILERSEDDVIRSNIIIALGDLSFRFPNLIEPWTPRIYARLQDTSVSVRRTTLTVLTHLILNDMVKVKGQISDMAVRIVDPVDSIAYKARSFFAELSNKGNALYNVMADIISRLSDTDVGVPESDFQTILRFILGLIQKDRQMESLVEKLCLRFRGAALPRHWRDLTFCMSLLNFSDRCVRKLTDNFSCFSDKLHDKDVYDCFTKIIANSKKLSKSSEARSQIDELATRLTEARKKAVEDDNATCSAARAAGRPTPAGTVTPALPLPDTAQQEEDSAQPERRSVCKAVPTPRRSAFSAQRLRRTRDSTATAAGDQSDDGAEEPFRAPAPPPPVQSKSKRATRTSSRRL